MSVVPSPAAKSPTRALAHRHHGLPLVIAGLSWIGYLFAQSGAIMLGIDSLHGCLLRLAAASLFTIGIVLIFLVFKPQAPVSAASQLVLNIIAVGFFVSGVAKLMALQPDIDAFQSDYSNAQILMTAALFFIARCLQVDDRFPRWLGILFYVYAVLCVAQTWIFLTGGQLAPYSYLIIALTLCAELLFAFTLVRVGVKYLYPQIFANA